MSRTINKRTPALWDLVNIADYLCESSPAAAMRFLDAAEAAFELLSRMPEIGSLCEFEDGRLEGLRAWPIRGFRRYIIHYLPRADGIDVFRVIHGARDTETQLLN